MLTRAARVCLFARAVQLVGKARRPEATARRSHSDFCFPALSVTESARSQARQDAERKRKVSPRRSRVDLVTRTLLDLGP